MSEIIILNLTQHRATPEQIQEGVFDLLGEAREELLQLLNFETLPSELALCSASENIAHLANNYFEEHFPNVGREERTVMIGGAPFFMSYLEDSLGERGNHPVYAFSERVSEDQTQPDGSVRKVSVFKHRGFVPARAWY